MKLNSFSRNARLAFLTFASAVFSTPMMAFGAPPDGTDVTAPPMIDAFEGTFGVNQARRKNQTKGTCPAFEFLVTAPAAVLRRSLLFSGKTIPVLARFSLGG